jgi:hypothetical protein
VKALIILLKRDFRNSFNKRFFILLIFMLLLQAWFILGSGSVEQVLKTGQMNFMAMVFSFNLFGSIIALAFNYDSISVERESKVLDLVLTSGISKKKVFLSKAVNSFLISGIFALLYTIVIFLVYLVASKDTAMSLLTFRYAFPVMAFMSIYCLMGLMLSIIFRSSRESLVVSVILGGLFIPRLFLLVVEGIGKVLSLGERTTELLGMISPALIMNALSGYAEKLEIFLGVILLMVYLTVMIVIGIVIFTRQDELNYGE